MAAGKPAPDALTAAVSRAADAHTGSAKDYDTLIDRVGGCSLVLLGEATHGSAEIYRERAIITRRLIEERGYRAVVVEADWPDAYRVNRYVRGMGGDTSAEQALGDFVRFPRWMWRNREVRDFVAWLRDYNLARPDAKRVGFYGLDLYSLYSSIEAVVKYLISVDPDAARTARQRYGCLGQVGDEPSRYGYGVLHGQRRSCRDEAVSQLIDLREKAAAYLRRDGIAAADQQFDAEQNARVIANGEAYYRHMFGRRVNTWNLRDQHMAETLLALHDHLAKRGGGSPRLAVWAHNSHIGDASHTAAADRDELNLGQLTRRTFADDVALVGFTTYHGTVSAAPDWDEPVQTYTVRDAIADSLEDRLHATGIDRFTLVMDRMSEDGRRLLDQPRLQRMIGVIYRPQTERASHCLTCRAASQYDAIVHLDRTSAVVPLDPAEPVHDAPRDTYPSGL